MSNECYVMPSRSGGKLLVLNKHVFRKSSRLNSERNYWICSSHDRGCKARIITDDNGGLTKVSNPSHNHPPNTENLLRRKFTTKMKERVRQEPSIPVPRLYREEVEKAAAISQELADALPSYNSLQRTLYRVRSAHKRSTIVPYVTGEPIDIEYDPLSDLEVSGVPSNPSTRKGLLERLKDNVVIGDGGFVFSLEKRGYVKAGPWTPEAAVEHPDAVRNLHREFLRAGSDVMQAFSFYASDDKLINRGHDAGKLYTGSDINEAACKIAREVADEGDALVAGGISQTPTYLSNKGKAAVQAEFKKQVDVFVKNKLDFLICEYFEHIEEMEWAIEVCKKTGLPVAATMCIGSEGDLHGISAGECAVRMAKAGADVVGLNCHFDPFKTLETIAIMKTALNAQGLKPYLMTQPLAFHTPDASKQGFIDLPEFPFALEPRVCTRWDMQRYAREAYELGVRYIGGCCGFESYHIRAVSEELAKERGKQPQSSKKHEPWGEGLKMHTKPWVRARARRDYWENINPSTGRPFSAAFSKPDNWGVTAGSEDLKQKAESTTKEELQKVFTHKAK